MSELQRKLTEDFLALINDAIELAKSKGHSTIGIGRMLPDVISNRLQSSGFTIFYKSMNVGDRKLFINRICWDNCWINPDFENGMEWDLYLFKSNGTTIELCLNDEERKIPDGRCKIHSNL